MKVIGIPVSVSPFSEKNAMVNILTSKGLLSFCSYGGLSITNKNFPSLNLFSMSEFTFSDSNKNENYELKESSLINLYPSLHEKLNCLSSLQFFEEFLKKMFDNESASSMFEYLKNILDLMESGFDPLTLVIIFLAVGLKKNGYGLDIDSCVLCGTKKGINTISFEDGGFVCKDCCDDFMPKMNSEKLKIYRYIFMVGFNDINRVTFNHDLAKEVFDELVEYAFNQTGVYLKSAGLIKKSL